MSGKERKRWKEGAEPGIRDIIGLQAFIYSIYISSNGVHSVNGDPAAGIIGSTYSVVHYLCRAHAGNAGRDRGQGW